ncbi:MAG: hypothetical protein QOE70_2285 [Chthoniobacter sp.]|nr:hypothetical protein [Chthoniobacter sp.]
MLPIPLAMKAVIKPKGSPAHQPTAPKTLIPTKMRSFTGANVAGGTPETFAARSFWKLHAPEI